MKISADEVVTLLRRADHAALERRAREALAADDGDALAWKALSVALSAQGREALAALERAAALAPGDAEAQSNYGHALRARGRHAEAAAVYQRALRLNGGSAALHLALGNAQLAGGDPGAAADSYRQALAIDARLAEAHCNLGAALRSLGRLQDARRACEQALAIRPDFAIALCSLGELNRELGDSAQAAACCRRAIALAPQLAAAHNGLGNALLDLGAPGEAAASYRRALELDGEGDAARINLALALRQLGAGGEARSLCEAVLGRSPRSAPALVLLAELHTDGGDFEAARALLRRAVEADPRSAEAQAGFAYLGRMGEADAGWAAAALELASTAPPRQQIHLRYALGKYHDDRGEWDAAFAQFALAHELQRGQGRAYDRREASARVDRLVRTQDAAWLRRVRAQADPSPRAVFIVGMPRSGTSLVEQILASHPDVYGAGELPFWEAVAARGTDADDASTGGQYLAALPEAAGRAGRVTDKMPANYWHVGRIHAALPHARFIHVRRDPRDTCVSIFCQNFRNAYPFAHDLEDLAHCYRDYARLMQHWREALPADTFLDVDYEDLVDDAEGGTRRMLGFLGLGWDARCLGFEHTRREVLTASKWQVRQKISRASVGRWRHYERHIGPLLGL